MEEAARYLRPREEEGRRTIARYRRGETNWWSLNAFSYSKTSFAPNPAYEMYVMEKGRRNRIELRMNMLRKHAEHSRGNPILEASYSQSTKRHYKADSRNQRTNLLRGRRCGKQKRYRNLGGIVKVLLRRLELERSLVNRRGFMTGPVFAIFPLEVPTYRKLGS